MYISTKWVLTDTVISGQRKVKVTLVARGFEEKNEELMKDFPNCAKESMPNFCDYGHKETEDSLN